jgi:hypothetical protein
MNMNTHLNYEYIFIITWLLYYFYYLNHECGVILVPTKLNFGNDYFDYGGVINSYFKY